jgi:cytochrome b561/polyisoprenoid-binding protein YceI
MVGSVQRDEYTAVAKRLHWLIAILIFVLFPLAWVMGDFSNPIQKFQAYNLHKSLGISVLILMVLRVLWRFANPPPALPRSMPRLERVGAHLGHFALYVALFLMPLTGWAMISSSNKPSVLFQYTAFPLIPWLARLPADEKKTYEEIFMNAHGLLANILLALIALHVAAALRHAILLKDGIFTRIMPRLSRRARPFRAAILFFAALGLWTVGGDAARATEWSVTPQKSVVEFEASGSGYTTKGTFPRYKADIEFDPDTPDQTAIHVSFDMKSATAGVSDVDSVLRSAEYFNPDQFPTAEFVARGAKPTGKGSYVLDGRLTLKGITKPVSLPFSMTIDAGTATIKAETTINRMDFGIGPETVGGLTIDKDVKLTIDLTAVRLDN